jgi:hypothetical protein
MKKSIMLLSAAGLAGVFASGSAFAQAPASVVSSTWSIRANNTSNITLDIKSQATVGNCPSISGTFVDGAGTTGVVGFYCPSTGLISFLRTNSNGSSAQAYTGQVITLSTNPTVLGMDGTFLNASGGANGAYPFEGSNAVVTPPPIQ